MLLLLLLLLLLRWVWPTILLAEIWGRGPSGRLRRIRVVAPLISSMFWLLLLMMLLLLLVVMVVLVFTHSRCGHGGVWPGHSDGGGGGG